MWDDFTIGKGDRLNSATKCFDIDKDDNELSISENKNCYWINNIFSCLGGRVFKDTLDGKLITQMRDEKCDVDIIIKEIEVMVLPYLTPKGLYVIKEAAYKQGRRDKMDEIKSVLEIGG